MAIDTGHAALGEQGMGLTPSVALWLNCARIVTAPASDAVPGTDFGESLLVEAGPTRLPNFGIAEIVSQLNIHVVHTRGDMDVGLDKPVGRWDVAIAATRPHAFVAAAMLRFLKIRIRGLEHHGVTGRAKGVGRSVTVDRGAYQHAAGANEGGDQQ